MSKAELAGLYIVVREAEYIRIILEELGHKQPPTPLQTDSAMADAEAPVHRGADRRVVEDRLGVVDRGLVGAHLRLQLRHRGPLGVGLLARAVIGLGELGVALEIG